MTDFIDVAKDRIKYIEEAMEMNSELAEYWCKLKDLSPKKLTDIANDMNKPVLQIILAKSLLLACQEGLAIEKVMDRLGPTPLTLNLRTYVAGMANPFSELDKK